MKSHTDRQQEKSRVVWMDLRNFPAVTILPQNERRLPEPRKAGNETQTACAAIKASERAISEKLFL